MAATAELTIILKTVDQATAGLQSVQKSLGEQQKAIQNVHQQSEAFSGGMTGLATRFVIFSAALQQATSYLGTLFGAFQSLAIESAEDQRAIDQLNRTLDAHGASSRGTTQALVGFAEAMQRVTTFSNTQFTLAMQQAIDSNVKLADVQRVVTIAADLAAAKQISLESATQLVSKAYNGQTEMLKRYGIFIDEATAKTQGTDFVLTALSRNFGGAAKTDLENYIGAQRQLANAWADVKRAMGDVFQPAFASVIRMFAEGTSVVADFLDHLNLLPRGYMTDAEAHRAAYDQWKSVEDKKMAMAVANRDRRWKMEQEEANALKVELVGQKRYLEDVYAVRLAHHEKLGKLIHAYLEAERKERMDVIRGTTDFFLAAGEATGAAVLKAAGVVVRAVENVMNALMATNPILQILGIATSFFGMVSSLNQLDDSASKLEELRKLREEFRNTSNLSTGFSSFGNQPSAPPELFRLKDGRLLNPGGSGGGQLVINFNNGIMTGDENTIRKTFDKLMAEWNNSHNNTVFA